MKHTPKMYRQGDVLIVPVKTLPKGRAEVKSGVPGRVVLAYGEVTGHHHSIEKEDATLTEFEGATYLEVAEALADLEHQEHSTIQIPKGKYRVIRQREYTPEAIRNVAD